MEKPDPLIFKNVRTTPEQTANDGRGSVRLSATVFTAADEARIVRVEADLSGVRGSSAHPLRFRPEEGIASSREGPYTCTVRVPFLSDPGVYPLPLRALDDRGNKGYATAELNVTYRRPTYRGDVLSHANGRIFDRVSGSSAVGGSRVEVLTDGAEAFQQRMTLIRGARKQINLQTYALSAEGMCGEFAEALSRKEAEGVEVNLLINMSSQLVVSPFTAVRIGLHKVGRELRGLTREVEEILEGRQGVREMLEDVQKVFRDLRRGARGINVILADGDTILGAETAASPSRRRSERWLERMASDRKELDRAGANLPAGWFLANGGLPSLPFLTYALHEKILVVDGSRAIVGGRNLEDRYFEHWVDTDLRLEGPVVRQVQEGFLRTWEELSRNVRPARKVTRLLKAGRARGPCRTRFVQSRPWLGEYQSLETVVAALQAARERVFIQSQYVVLPDGLLREALLDTARRGVEVHIVTNSHETGQEVYHAAGYLLTLNYCKDLLNAGIRIHLMTGPEAPNVPKPYLHAKTFLVDGKWAAVGSFNLSIRSCYIESENLVVVEDPAFTEAHEAHVRQILREGTRELTREVLQEQQAQLSAWVTVARYLELFF